MEAVLFYFLEVFYNNPVFFLAALLTYVLVTSRWTLNFSVPNRTPPTSDAATQTDNKSADNETETEQPKPKREPGPTSSRSQRKPEAPESQAESRRHWKRQSAGCTRPSPTRTSSRRSQGLSRLWRRLRGLRPVLPLRLHDSPKEELRLAWLCLYRDTVSWSVLPSA